MTVSLMRAVSVMREQELDGLDLISSKRRMHPSEFSLTASHSYNAAWVSGARLR